MKKLEKDIRGWLDMYHGAPEYDVAESVAVAAMEWLDDGRAYLIRALDTVSGRDGALVADCNLIHNADIYAAIADMGQSIEAWLNRYIEDGGAVAFDQRTPASFATLVWTAFEVAAHDLAAYLHRHEA